MGRLHQVTAAHELIDYASFIARVTFCEHVLDQMVDQLVVGRHRLQFIDICERCPTL
jgi:hypothetical protein